MLMSKMREWSKYFIYVVVVAFVGTIFFTWGMDISRSKDIKNAVGKVNNREVTYSEFQKAMTNVYQQMRGNRPEDEMIDMRQVRDRTWNEFVMSSLMQEVFERYQLGASEEQLIAFFKYNPPPALTRVPLFMNEDSVFDTTIYYSYLNNPQFFQDPTVRMLEAQAKGFLIPGQTLESIILASAQVNHFDVEREARESLDKAVFEYAKIPLHVLDLDSGAVTSSEISAYYEQYPDSFQTKGKADINYVRFDKKANARDDRRVMQDLLDIKKRIEGGKETFEEAAKAESEDGSAAQGGDLGWFGSGDMVKEFEAAAQGLEKGQISNPVRTQFGWHLIRLEDKRVKDGKEELHARHILIKVMPSLETLDSLKLMADSLMVQVSRGVPLKKAAQAMQTPVLETGLFEKGSNPPYIGQLAGLSAMAFRAEGEEEDFEVLENREAYYACEVSRVIPAGRIPLKDCEDRIRKRLMKLKRYEAAAKRLQTAAEKLPPDAPLTEISKIDTLIRAGVTDTVTRGTFVSEVGTANPVIYKAFSQAVGETSGPVEERFHVFIVRTLYKQAADAKILQNEVPVIYAQALERKKYQAYNVWLENVKENAEIENNLDLFFNY